jgi:preprotein translocase subunit YajC
MLNTLFANYWLVSIIILIIWVGILIFYLYVSQQHQALENELDSLSQLLEEDQNGRRHLD